MGVFAYKAMEGLSHERSGTIAADSPALARQALRERGLSILSLEQSRPAAKRGFRLRRPAQAAEQVAELWRNLATLLEAGVPLIDGLGICIQQQRGRLQPVLRQVEEDLRAGLALSAALQRHPDWFDEFTRVLVEVGQRAGALDRILRELAEFQLRQRTLRQRLSTALIYPVILCFVGTGVVLFLMNYVVPQLLEVLTSAGREWPWPTRVLKSVSDFLAGNLLWLALAAIGLAFGLAAWRRTDSGRRRLERIALALPVLGDLLRKSWVARFSLMLATLLRADVRFIDALRTVRTGLPQRLLADELERLERAVEAGADIAAPLRDSRLLPPLVVRLLEVGQQSGELPRMLEQLRAAYESEVQLALARFLAVLEPVLILILAIVIGFVVFATLLPILETTRIAQ